MLVLQAFTNIKYNFQNLCMTELSISESGGDWNVKSEGNTLVWTFNEGMSLSKFGEEAYPTYEQILADHGEKIEGMVTVIEMDDPFNEDAFEVWENAGKKAQEEGIRKWALVADGLTKISLRGKLDYDDLRVKGFEEKDEAVEWSRDQ